VVQPDIFGSNGVIHLVDNVIMPAGLTAQLNALVAASATAATAATAAVSDAVLTPTDAPDLSTLLASRPELSTLANLCLAGGPRFHYFYLMGGTLIAPTNDAFAQLPASVLAFLTDPNNKPVLANVLFYHALSAPVSASQLKDRTQYPNAQKLEVGVFVEYGTDAIYFNYAKVQTADLRYTNSGAVAFVHTVDHVLLPPGLVPGAVQLPFFVPTAPQYIGSAFAGSIVDAAVATPALSALVAAVKKAGLVSVLSGAGPFTVFAPTNDAFGLLNPAVLNALTIAQLTQVLEYHVVAGAAVLSTQVQDQQKIATVQKTSVTAFKTTAGGLFVDFAAVSAAARDIVCTNGVVHVIDHVLIPPFMQGVLQKAAVRPAVL
jgi:transforming growth factor-beta-induced protein